MAITLPCLVGMGPVFHSPVWIKLPTTAHASKVGGETAFCVSLVIKPEDGFLDYYIGFEPVFLTYEPKPKLQKVQTLYIDLCKF